MKLNLFYIAILVFSAVFVDAKAQLDTSPKTYVCYYTPSPLFIDGKLDEGAWEAAPWSEAFVDIEGDIKPKPAHLTRMKMLWDEDYFYIGVKLDEPHIWATYTERESVIFHENDIEVFLDPDGDTHHYYEWEINALGTLWDLMLTRPYKNGGRPINGWNINEFEYAIHLEGTLNDPSDLDEYWSVEMAIPWASISNFRPPHDGTQWRINFSRVQWKLEVKDNTYQKVINPETDKPYPEDNWVWSPIGVINMHIPERWGYVQFRAMEVGKGTVPFDIHPDEQIKDILRTFYNAQKDYLRKNKRYAKNATELGLKNLSDSVNFEVSETRFKLSLPSIQEPSKGWFITEDSRVWKE